ncbi:MAG: hypothetical protein COA50_16840 [Flavobacteriaceae bacterium]|nr:MAG: hypothetical protein COA50_16840 [Flavobacteriaceae bacterium]
MFKKIIIPFTILFIFCIKVEAQHKKMEKIKDYNVARLLNNLEIISELQTNEFKIRIMKVANVSGSAGTQSSEVTHDIYIAVSEFDELATQNLYLVKKIHNPRDLIWLSKDSIPEFRINYASSFHMKTMRFLIYADKVERVY